MIVDEVAIGPIGTKIPLDQMAIRPNDNRRNGYWTKWLLDEMVIGRNGNWTMWVVDQLMVDEMTLDQMAIRRNGIGRNGNKPRNDVYYKCKSVKVPQRRIESQFI